MTDQSGNPAAELREQMIVRLVEAGEINSPELAAAFRAVARHEFTPGATPEAAYDPWRAAITKWDDNGVPTSSVSAPQLQALQIEQAQIKPGDRVLEVGSGGYNAALLAEMVGPTGQVTTIDIDPEVTERAARLLRANGYDHVHVVTADAEHGVANRAPFDAIVVTVGAWDIPPAWTEQLAEGGLLVVPLRLRGLTRSIAFRRVGDHLVSESARICGFVAMQGIGEHTTQLLLVKGDAEIGLRFDDEVMVHPSDLDNAVCSPRFETLTGVTVGTSEPFDTLQLFLATRLDGFCIMAVDPALDTGTVAPANKASSSAAVQGHSLAYLTWCRADAENTVEFVVHALGPEAADLAATMAEQVRQWDAQQRGGPGPHFAVYPAGTPGELPGERVITKRHSRITISWPTAAAADATAS